MQAAFPIVVFGTVGLSVVMSIVFLLSKGSMYDEIGSGGFPSEGEHSGGESSFGQGGSDYDSIAMNPEFQRAEREQEIRQMLQARSERRQRRGEPALDVDAEFARLTAAQPASPGHDPGIAEEVLQLVVARNERRERQGLEPLDLEAEVARTLAELTPEPDPDGPARGGVHRYGAVGYKRAMAEHRTFELDELTIRPGTYFNPQTEVLLVVDDSPDLDHEIFNMEDFEGDEWVLVSDESPVDEHRRDELIERFQVTYHPGGEHSIEGDADDEEEDVLEADDQEVGREDQ